MSRLLDAIELVWNYTAAGRLQKFRHRADVEAHQQRQWERLRRQVFSRASFYAACREQDFGDLPVLDKRAWMSHFDDINTAGITLDQALALAEEAERTRDFSPR